MAGEVREEWSISPSAFLLQGRNVAPDFLFSETI